MLDVLDNELKTIYRHIIPIKAFLLAEILVGSATLTFIIFRYQINGSADIWTYAAALLSTAIILTALTDSKISVIETDSSQKVLKIYEESLYSTKVKKIKFNDLKSKLIFGNGRKSFIVMKLRLDIFQSDKKTGEIKSDFIGSNNRKLKKLHAYLKEISE